MCLALTSLGAGIASSVEDFQGFQGINNLMVTPLFFLSGALYPLKNIPLVLRIISEINPVSYMVDSLRYLLGGPAQSHFGIGKDLIVIAISLVLSLIFAVNRFNRIQM
jgi:ABC-2 type transport system permease protein